MSRDNKIIGATILLMGVTFSSKIISFIREIFIAAEFGTSQQADIFVAVSTIPILLLTVSSGALSAALVPMIIRLRNQDDSIRLKQLVSSIFSLTSLIMLGLTLLLYIFIIPFTDVYVIGFDQEAKMLTADMIKIIIPALVAIVLISLFSAVLNAHHHFFTPSLGPIFYSLGIIVATVLFAKDYGVKSLIIGMAIGIALQFILILIVAFKKGIRFIPRIHINEDVKKVGLLILPIFIGIGAFQINTLVDRMMASTLPHGSLAALNYANRITQLPLSIFVGSMVLPLFPAIADKIADKNFDGARSLISRSYHLLGIILIPVIGVFVVLAEPVVAILFQRGEFDADASKITGLALAFYAFMILPFAMRDIMTRALYSMQDTWTPVINSVLLVAVNVILMITFVPKLGMIAIAGSTSLSAIFGYTRLRYKLNKKMGKGDTRKERRIWLLIWRNAILFILIAWTSYQGLYLFLDNPTGFDLWFRTLAGIFVAGIIYIYLTLRLDTEEVKWLKSRVKDILKKVLRKE